MIMAVYEADKAAGHENRGWLERASPLRQQRL